MYMLTHIVHNHRRRRHRRRHINLRNDLRNLPMGFKLSAANIINTINDVQVFNIFKSCMDTTGPFTIPLITSLQDMNLEV